MTHPAGRFSETAHHRLTAALLVVLFWTAAATLVASARTMLDQRSPQGAAVVTFATILVVAYAYSRLCARDEGITHALGVGIAWLLLTIVTEIVLSACIGRDWYALLGSPDRPLLRNCFLFAWIFAPAILARNADDETNE